MIESLITAIDVGIFEGVESIFELGAAAGFVDGCDLAVGKAFGDPVEKTWSEAAKRSHETASGHLVWTARYLA